MRSSLTHSLTHSLHTHETLTLTPTLTLTLTESDFARPGQGPGAPAQQWLREVASEATLRLQPQRQRVDHADVLRPLRSALAVLRTNPNPNPNLTLTLT